MQIYLNSITGIADAITSLYFSKRSWTKEKEAHIRKLCSLCLDENGFPYENQDVMLWLELQKDLQTVFKFGIKHITLLRFIDLSFTIEGLHRGAQDDLDAHAKRMDNRIIRSSTRLATFGDEKSEWYEDKILTTDDVSKLLSINLPETYIRNGVQYTKATNGYIRSDLIDNFDVKRGLYMLSIPSNCIFKVNVTEFAHIVKERDKNSGASPELKEAIESAISQLTEKFPGLNREFFYNIKN